MPDSIITAPLDDAQLDYDRDALTIGVAHIGVGGFHRAHQATYFNELAELGVTDWGILGIALRTRDTMEALEDQDLLFTVVERGAGDDHELLVGALLRFLHAPDDPEEVYAALADPAIRLVTLTVTGDGYDGGDATFAAYLVEALRRRRDAGTPPFTVLSCDNVPGNGAVTRAAVVGFARLSDPELADWIDAHVSFPSSMVDRITPGAEEPDAPVATEPFRQWIIEDDFADGRPPLERVGAQFVPDVGPYETMKKRMLNGTHCALGYLGTLAGCRTTDEVMEDPELGRFVTRLVEDEIAPLVGDVPGIDLGDYTQTLLGRLANPKIGDELSRLCRRGSTKVPSYLLPSLHDAIRRDRPHELLTLAVAGWVRYLQCCDDVQDARADELRDLAADPRRFAAERSIFGDLADDRGFADDLAAAVERLS